MEKPLFLVVFAFYVFLVFFFFLVFLKGQKVFSIQIQVLYFTVFFPFDAAVPEGVQREMIRPDHQNAPCVFQDVE